MEDGNGKPLDQQPTLENPLRGSKHSPRATAPSIQVFARYINLEFLGQGGSARVYKAWDPELARFVALKFLKIDDPEWRIRQIREAHAQAKIDHPNVCKIFEATEAEGRQYIAMQYINGETLAEAASSISLEKKIRIMYQVTLAIQEAHRNGLIHRDIKPHNIMVERDAYGEMIPYVMDFGLARETNAPGLTVTGIVMGTPSYMSPEQARGNSTQIDRRSDIYSIGASLYAVLTLQPPFAGDSSMQVLHRVLYEEPEPPRRKNPSIPRDLEIVVMKCLEKDPDRRYDSARALADDLNRYLSGDPVLARAPTVTYRLYRHVKKHPAVSLLLLVASVLVLFAAGYAIHTRWRSAQQTHLLQEFAQQTQEIDGIMRYAALLPIHNVTPEIQMVRERVKEIEKQMNRIGGFALGPGNYSLGRGSLALHEYDKSRHYLELSWNRYNYKEPHVASALGLTLAKLYQREFSKASHIRNAADREIRLKTIEKEYREPALNYIKIGKSNIGSPQYIASLIAFLEKKYDSSLTSAQAALKQTPWLYEARKLQGDTFGAMANEYGNTGDYSKAISLYAKANHEFQEALTIGRSDSETYLAICNIQIDIVEHHVYQSGESPTVEYEKGVKACENALKIRPDDPEISTHLLWLHNTYGYYQVWTSLEDARPVLDKALQAGRNSISLDPNNSATQSQLCRTFILRGEYDNSHGDDPRDWLKQATDCLSVATKLDPQNANAYSNLSITEYQRAWYEFERGIDPRPALERSINAVRKSIELEPKRKAYWRDLGGVCLLKADNELRHGLDVRPTVTEIVNAEKRAIELNPNEQLAHFNLGHAYFFQAAYEVAHGIDPSKSIENGERSLSTALKINPSDDYCYVALTWCGVIKAQYIDDAGGNPDAALNKAEIDSQKAVKLAGRAEAYTNLGIVYIAKSEALIKRGENPETILSQARSVLQKAKALGSPEMADISLLLGKTELNAAQWNFHQGRSPEPFAQKAVQNLEESLRTNSQLAESHLQLAKTRYLLGKFKEKRGVSAKQELEQALSDLDHALALNPQLAEAFATKGEILRFQKSVEESETAFNQAFQINPLLKKKYTRN